MRYTPDIHTSNWDDADDGTCMIRSVSGGVEISGGMGRRTRENFPSAGQEAKSDASLKLGGARPDS